MKKFSGFVCFLMCFICVGSFLNCSNAHALEEKLEINWSTFGIGDVIALREKVYAEPDENSEIIDEYIYGSVYVTGKVSDTAFSQVVIGDQIGYMHSGAISLESYTLYPCEDIEVLSSIYSDAKLFGKIKSGEPVKVLYELGNYYAILSMVNGYTGGIGYISKDYVYRRNEQKADVWKFEAMVINETPILPIPDSSVEYNSGILEKGTVVEVVGRKGDYEIIKVPNTFFQNGYVKREDIFNFQDYLLMTPKKGIVSGGNTVFAYPSQYCKEEYCVDLENNIVNVHKEYDDYVVIEFYTDYFCEVKFGLIKSSEVEILE